MEERAKETTSFNMKYEVFDWVESVVFSLVVLVLLFTFVFRTVGIKGESMEPTLNNGDSVIISNLFYTPKQHDVVVISKPEFSTIPIIKRVIAVAGQTVKVNYSENAVYVDGVKLDEPYILEAMRKIYTADTDVTVPDGCIFAMGDNRNNSSDSRDPRIGMVDAHDILGRAVVRVFPFSKVGLVK